MGVLSSLLIACYGSTTRSTPTSSLRDGAGGADEGSKSLLEHQRLEHHVRGAVTPGPTQVVVQVHGARSVASGPVDELLRIRVGSCCGPIGRPVEGTMLQELENGSPP